MLQNYILTTLRNFSKYKVYSSINIIGLVIGITSSILIFLFVQNELSYDKFYPDHEKIYRLIDNLRFEDNFKPSPILPSPWSHVLMDEIPEVEEVVRIDRAWTKRVLSSDNKKFFEDKFFWVDKNMINFFGYKLINGNPDNVLEAPYSMVITKEKAIKYFGSVDVIGEKLQLDNADYYNITGVIENSPLNSHFKFDFLASLSTREEDQLNNTWLYNYVKISDKVNINELNQKTASLFDSKFPDQYRNSQEFKARFQQVSDIHFASELIYDFESNASKEAVYLYSTIAALILIIACINFMNLVTARFSVRQREIGMRKVLGAGKNQLIFQFLGESFIYTLFSLIISIILIETVMPYYNNFIGRPLALNLIDNTALSLFIFSLTIFVGLFAGSYPSFVLSRHKPNQVLKSNSTHNKGGSINIRRTLVVFQFAVSIFLIFATMIVYEQLSYMKNSALGFSKEQIVSIPLRPEMRENKNVLQSNLINTSGIEDIAFSSSLPGQIDITYLMQVKTELSDENSNNLLPVILCDEDFVEALDFDLIDGRPFDKEIVSDSSAMILNESAVKFLKLDNPLGKEIEFGFFNRKGKVVGVVKDFHLTSLHDNAGPVILHTAPDLYLSRMVVKLNTDNIKETMQLIESGWNNITSEYPFEYNFFDDIFDKQYKDEEESEKRFFVFTIVAIVISCLGLLGLISFSAEQKTKEIGIRKVLGASLSSIVVFILREFFKLIVISNIITLPLAYYFANEWLQSFAYRISLGPEAFLVAAFLSVFIALASVSFLTMKAASANPIKSIKYE